MVAGCRESNGCYHTVGGHVEVIVCAIFHKFNYAGGPHQDQVTLLSSI